MIRRGSPDPVAVALAAARRTQGLTLADVSQRLCGSDSARTQLSLWERGLAWPTLHSLRRWADALGLDLTTAAKPSREGA